MTHSGSVIDLIGCYHIFLSPYGDYMAHSDRCIDSIDSYHISLSLLGGSITHSTVLEVQYLSSPLSVNSYDG